MYVNQLITVFIHLGERVVFTGNTLKNKKKTIKIQVLVTFEAGGLPRVFTSEKFTRYNLVIIQYLFARVENVKTGFIYMYKFALMYFYGSKIAVGTDSKTFYNRIYWLKVLFLDTWWSHSIQPNRVRCTRTHTHTHSRV